MIGGVEMFRDLRQVDALRKELRGTYTCDDNVSKSAAMKEVRDLLPLVARSDSTVLIEDEPGTGKELVARAIHNLDARSSGPFVAVNCGALPGNVRELENAIEHGFVVCAGENVRLDDLPLHIRSEQSLPTQAPRLPDIAPSQLNSAEADAIREALDLNNGNRTKTAKSLGLSRNTLWRKMKRHSLS